MSLRGAFVATKQSSIKRQNFREMIFPVGERLLRLARNEIK